MSPTNDGTLTESLVFKDDGATPNNPRFSLLVYRKALATSDGDLGTAIESLFAANGWCGFWRNGVFDFHHYHSTCHEALGVARGWAEIRFGGEDGRTMRVGKGDVAVLPAGTGHKQIEASPDFLVVGAYPPDQPYDLVRAEDAAAHDGAVARIAAVPFPATDPVFGDHGGLRTRWAKPG